MFAVRCSAWSARRESPPPFKLAFLANSVRRGQHELEEEQVSSAAWVFSLPFFACHGYPLLVSFPGVCRLIFDVFGATHSSNRWPASRIARIREAHAKIERRTLIISRCAKSSRLCAVVGLLDCIWSCDSSG